MNPIDTIVWNDPQLFVDSELIECCQCVSRRWHKPVRDPKPVLTADRPWEDCLYFTYSNYTVLHDPLDGKLKCWYEDLGKIDCKTHPSLNSLLYAESTDGVNFSKPELDICSVDGRHTNIVMGNAKGGPATAANPWALGGAHSNAILINPHPATPEQRFLTVFTGIHKNPEGRFEHRTSGAFSPDGLHWQPFGEPPCYGSSRNQLSDVSCLWYDHNSRSFVQNTRHGRQYSAATPPAGAPAPVTNWFQTYYPNRPDLMNKRRIFQARSHDFIHWSEPLVICQPDDVYDNLDEAYYGMPQFQVGRQHFGLLGIFHVTDNSMYVRLMHSRDGVNWRPADNAAPFLAPRGSEHWDAFMVSMTSPPIERNGEWLFYHGGTSSHHDWWMSGRENLDVPEARDPGKVRFQLGLARLRKEGFASLYAGPVREGYAVIKPLCSEGDSLLLNAACGPGGYVRAEVTDLNGQPLGNCSLAACDAFSGDSVRHAMSWGGDTQVPGGGAWSKRRLRFVLRNAHIYSFTLATAGANGAKA